MLIIDPSNDPYFNLAAEEFLLREREGPVFRLWRSSPSVVIGRHQIPEIEVDTTLAARLGTPILRRLSGGGAVYHDMGNVNFTIVSSNTPSFGMNYELLLTPIVAALNLTGVPAKHVGRGDLRLEGAKISGGAFYLWRGRMLHHGTLLFDADLDRLNDLLNVKEDNVTRPKSIRSIRSPVTNINAVCTGRFACVEDFMKAFCNVLAPMLGDNPASARPFTESEKKRIGEIADATYRRPDWNESGKL